MKFIRITGNTIPFFLLAMMLFIPIRVEAMMVITMTLEEMTSKAEVIISAKVQSVHVGWDYDGIHSDEQIFTFVELTDIVSCKGTFSGNTIRLKGGTIWDGTGEYESCLIPGMPEFAQGEEVVVFLSGSPAGSPISPVMCGGRGKMSYSAVLIDRIQQYLSNP